MNALKNVPLIKHFFEAAGVDLELFDDGELIICVCRDVFRCDIRFSQRQSHHALIDSDVFEPSYEKEKSTNPYPRPLKDSAPQNAFQTRRKPSSCAGQQRSLRPSLALSLKNFTATEWMWRGRWRRMIRHLGRWRRTSNLTMIILKV